MSTNLPITEHDDRFRVECNVEKEYGINNDGCSLDATFLSEASTDNGLASTPPGSVDGDLVILMTPDEDASVVDVRIHDGDGPKSFQQEVDEVLLNKEITTISLEESVPPYIEQRRSGGERNLLRCALLGCGMMGQEHCSYAMGYPDQLRIDYFCDPHQPSLNKCLEIMNEFRTSNHSDHHQPIFLRSEDELMEHISNIDLLVIATPNYLHTDTLIRFGQYEHLTILLEKPVAVSPEQHAKLSSALHDGSNMKARVWVAMEYRFIPAIAKLIDLIPTVVGDTVHMVTIRENRFQFLNKVDSWNRDSNKTGDSLVEKCCHFFDLMRLITKREVRLDRIQSTVQRGINYQDEAKTDRETCIIDSAYVILPFHSNPEQTDGTSKSIGCLELCMFADGSRHQEEVIVTGALGRLEAYLPENKVYAFKRPDRTEWSDRSLPPSKQAIQCTEYDCSDVKTVHSVDAATSIPTHSGHHYCSTAIEWYKLLQAIHMYNETGLWKPDVSLEDGLRAVEIGIHATQKAL